MQWHIRIHQNGIAVEPEEPFQPFRSRSREFSPKNRKQKRMFGPETREQALAEYELGVPMEVVVNLV
jgi:hypothetical protein